jgi:hypothetical protein
MKRESGDPEKKLNDEHGRTSQTKVRKYDQSYLPFGMTVSVGDECQECIVCFEKLLNQECKAIVNTVTFLTEKTVVCVIEPCEFYKQKETQLQQNNGIINCFCSINKRAMKASYQVSLRTIKAGKSHTIIHTLMLLAAKVNGECCH